MKILGIDPGLANTGWAILEGDLQTKTIRATSEFGVIKTVKWRDKKAKIQFHDRDRLDYIADEFRKITENNSPQHIVIEDFVFFGNRGATTSIMPVLIETLRMQGRALGYEVVILANGSWKKMLLKNHVANKNQVQHYVHRALGLDTKIWDKQDPGGHIRDAMALALTQWAYLTVGARKPVKQQTISMNWGK